MHLSPELSQFYQQKTILITGSQGYIGKRLTALLSNMAKKVICVSHKQTNNSLIPNIDLTCSTAWQQVLANVDIVFHLAAENNLAITEEQPLLSYQANLAPMLALLSACKTYKLRPFIVFTGSASQVGLPENLPVDEDSLDNPVSIYDLHKYCAERHLLFAKQQGIFGCSLRLSNVYGPGTHKGQGRGVFNKLVAQALRGEHLYLYGQGEQLRDYIYIDDVVYGLIVAGYKQVECAGEMFYLTFGDSISLKQAFNLVIQTAQPYVPYSLKLKNTAWPHNTPVIAQRSFSSSNKKFSNYCNWQPLTDLPTGLARLLEYYQNTTEYNYNS